MSVCTTCGQPGATRECALCGEPVHDTIACCGYVRRRVAICIRCESVGREYREEARRHLDHYEEERRFAEAEIQDLRAWIHADTAAVYAGYPS